MSLQALSAAPTVDISIVVMHTGLAWVLPRVPSLSVRADAIQVPERMVACSTFTKCPPTSHSNNVGVGGGPSRAVFGRLVRA